MPSENNNTKHYQIYPPTGACDNYNILFANLQGFAPFCRTFLRKWQVSFLYSWVVLLFMAFQIKFKYPLLPLIAFLLSGSLQPIGLISWSHPGILWVSFPCLHHNIRISLLCFLLLREISKLLKITLLDCEIIRRRYKWTEVKIWSSCSRFDMLFRRSWPCIQWRPWHFGSGVCLVSLLRIETLCDFLCTLGWISTQKR